MSPGGSSNAAAISISNANGFRGLATGVGTSDSSSVITATSGSIVSPGVTATTHVSWNSGGASSVFSIISCGNGGSGCHSVSSGGINQWVYNPSNAHDTYLDASSIASAIAGEPCFGSPPDMPPAGAPSGFDTPLTSAQCALLSQWATDGAPEN